jgi:hypothetical protein
MVLEDPGALFEEFLLPALENRGVQTVSVAQIGDRDLLQKMLFKDRDFLLGSVIFAFLGHGIFLRRW